MTPEERWTKIENSIQALAGLQAQHDSEIAENRRQIAENNKQITRITEKNGELDSQMEKNTAAIRDLILVSRTVIDSQQQIHSEIKPLLASLESLARTVDALVKSLQKPNGNQ